MSLTLGSKVKSGLEHLTGHKSLQTLSLFFEGFSVPPLHLDFDFDLAFHLPILVFKIVAFRLKVDELLGAALWVQLLTVVFGAVPRFVVDHCCPKPDSERHPVNMIMMSNPMHRT